MSPYWASWRPFGTSFIVREDTRIYWLPQANSFGGQCIGTFIGENPGGGEPLGGCGHFGPSPIQHRNQPGDGTLRLIRELWRTAVMSGFLPNPAHDDFIEVLNLYYFKCPVSAGTDPTVLNAWMTSGGAGVYSQAIHLKTKFVLLGWGEYMHTFSGLTTMLPRIQKPIKVIFPNSKCHVSLPMLLTNWTPLATWAFPVSPSFIKRSGQDDNYTSNIAPLL